MKKYPDWVEKYHTPGTTLKQIGDNYYLYVIVNPKLSHIINLKMSHLSMC